jgi:hypothetical protein
MKKQDWIWMPHAAHFIMANRCEFMAIQWQYQSCGFLTRHASFAYRPSWSPYCYAKD